MKTHIFLLLFFLGVFSAQAQGQFGVQLSPSISINRVHTNPNNRGFATAGSALRFKIGAIYDYPFQDRCCISTGLLYATQHFAIKNEDLLIPIREKHTSRNMQIPLFLKFHTSEIRLDTRLYVMLGILGQLKIDTRNTELLKSRQQPFVESFCWWGWGSLFGLGVEYDTSFSMSFFLGISYHYGFSSVINKQAAIQSMPQVMGYNDMLSVDIGVRF